MVGLWRKLLGGAGERAAARHLRRQGHRILARNFRCKAGEIDLITLDGQTVVFVEVRTRSTDVHGRPEETVNRAKQQQVKRVARWYLHRTSAHDRPCRFDVVAVVAAPGAKPVIRHIRDAFC